MDFTIGILIFLFTLGIYFGYTANFEKQEGGSIGKVLNSAQAISSSLVLSGFPKDWNSSNVIRIGISDDQRINSSKLQKFRGLNYSKTKNSFSTPYNYAVYFANKDGEVLNIDGTCSIGSSNVTTNFNTRSAYYYHDISNSYLKDFMENVFKADVYVNTEISQLASNVNNYGFILMENPKLSAADFNSYKDEIENFTANNGILLLSGEISADGSNLAGAQFYKKTDQSAAGRDSTINKTDSYFDFGLGSDLLFSDAYYAAKSSGNNFLSFASFTSDGNNATASWNNGNGTVYFFSSLSSAYSGGNFQNTFEDGLKSLIGGTCTPLNLSGTNTKKLATAERYLIYNSEVVKMVVYSWE